MCVCFTALRWLCPSDRQTLLGRFSGAVSHHLAIEESYMRLGQGQIIALRHTVMWFSKGGMTKLTSPVQRKCSCFHRVRSSGFRETVLRGVGVHLRSRECLWVHRLASSLFRATVCMEIAQSLNLTAAFGTQERRIPKRQIHEYGSAIAHALPLSPCRLQVSDQQCGVEMQILKRDHDETNAFKSTVMPVPGGSLFFNVASTRCIHMRWSIRELFRCDPTESLSRITASGNEPTQSKERTKRLRLTRRKQTER